MGDEMLASVCELAFDVAKEGGAPPSMKNYLYLAHRPPRAFSVAQRALEEDAAFRQRVAARATPDNVGEAGYLWLNRPSGWEHRFSELATGSSAPATPLAERPPMPEPPVGARLNPGPETPAPAPTISSIEDELSSLRGLVDRLADERQNVRSSVSDLEQELDTRRAENIEMSTRLSALRAEFATVQDTESKAAAERDEALARVELLEADVAILTADLERAQSEVKGSSAARDAAMADLATVAAEREELSASVFSLQSTAAAADDHAKDLAETIERLTAENAELTETAERLGSDNTELSRRLVVAEQARVDLEGQLEEVSGKWQSSARQLAVYSSVNAQLDAAVAERNALREHLSQTTEDIARLRATVANQHEQLSAELAELEQSVASPPEAPPVDEIDQTAELSTAASALEPVGAIASLDESPFARSTPLDVDVVPETERAFEDVADVPDDVDVPDDEDDVVGEDDDRSDEADASIDQPSTGGRRRIETPENLTDEESVARHVVAVPDVVLLIDGDGVAGLGWPHLDVAARRDALGRYLGALTADSGAAADVVFQRAVGGEETLPVSRAVRVRIADDSVATSSIVSTIVDGYPEEWPIAIVTDEPAVAARAEELSVTHLSNGQLLDLFLHLNADQ